MRNTHNAYGKSAEEPHLRDKVTASFLLTVGLVLLTIGLYVRQLEQLDPLVRVISGVSVAGIP